MTDCKRTTPTALRFLLYGVVMGVLTAFSPVIAAPQVDTAIADNSIRPFHIHILEEQLLDLRRRLAATRWPDQETVADRSQGAQLATMKDLVRYWQTDYDWRKVEAKLNALPQFITTIDGVDIHFIHVRSRHKNALPLIVTHGWPGSVIEQVKIIGPLTDKNAAAFTASANAKETRVFADAHMQKV